MPFDSDYKFMATFHVLPFRGAESVVALVKGGPDVILDRCAVALGPAAGTDHAGAARSTSPTLASAGRGCG